MARNALHRWPERDSTLAECQQVSRGWTLDDRLRTQQSLAQEVQIPRLRGSKQRGTETERSL